MWREKTSIICSVSYDFKSFLFIAGIDNRWPQKRSLFVLPRVLYGFVPLGRAKNNKSEGESLISAVAIELIKNLFLGDNCRYAEAAA